MLQCTIFKIDLKGEDRMSKSNWENLGEEISRTVQDAVKNQNYDKLNQVISDTIDQAMDAVANGVKNVTNTTQTKYRGYKNYTTDFDRAKKSSRTQYTNTKQETKQAPVVIETKTPSKIGTMALTVFGYAFGSFQLIWLAASLAAAFIADATLGLGPSILTGVFSVLSAALTGLGFGIGITGTRKIFRLERFKSYLAAIGQKEYCNVSELAAKVGKNSKSVIKDIEYMIKKRWFLQGHLDKQKTCLMVTDKMYSQYCQLEQQKAIEQKEVKEREAKEQKIREEKIAAGKLLSPEVQKVIDQGEDYVKKIRACNDLIPGEEISNKIYRIEMLVDKIFDRVEQNPKCVSDIRKLMDYYLPTTVKLLEAYAEMDAQPVGGENIRTAKREIEATLDTLNVAFEKLLDGLFQETAWDVSSDISVLNTMLAQEGLKEDGLKNKFGG